MSVDAYSGRTQAALRGAREYANDLRSPKVLPAHVVVALLADPSSPATEAFRRLGADPERLSRRIHDELTRQRGSLTDAGWDPTVESLLREAKRVAETNHEPFVRSHHLLLAAADGTWGLARRALQEAGITRTGLEYALRDLKPLIEQEGSASTATGRIAPGAATVPPASASTTLPSSTGGPAAANGAKGAATPPVEAKATTLAEYEILGEFGRDLTDMAASGLLDPVVGRTDELRRMMQVLGRRSKNNPILVGEPGVGKAAIVSGLAQRIANGDVPSSLAKKRVVQLDMASLVAGTSLRGQFEERIKKLVSEVASSQGNILLFVDEIHTLVTTGGRGEGGGASSLFKPALARGEITMIGTTTPADYRKYIESDKALERRFQDIEVRPTTVDESIAILRGIKQRFEIHHKVQIRDEALVAAVKLADRYVIERNLPDKAIDIIDESAAVLRLQFESEPAVIEKLKDALVLLEAERAALFDAANGQPTAALTQLDAAIQTKRDELASLEARLDDEKALAAKIAELKASMEATEKLIERAQADNDLGRAAELRYGVWKELEAEYAAVLARSKEMHQKGALLREEVTEEDVARVIAAWTGVPVQRMMESERQKLIDMETRLSRQVIGQAPAVKAIASAVRRSRAGVQSGKRPIGNFFFVGPTGVGKTELAKALAEFLFDSEQSLIRIDMSEYMEQSKVNSLIGSALGYVDSDKGGILTEAVRRRPYSVVLFDEAEKAHPDVFNLLLQVLDEGRLTDSQGRLVDFTNTIIIMTSNVGARDILDLTGKVPYEELDERVHTILRDHFKPEFLNRLDDTVVFNALDRTSLSQIMDILVRGLKKLLAQQGLQLEFSQAALDHVLDVGYQPEYGARPLKRALLTEVQDPLALALLEERFAPGDTIHVDVDGQGGLRFDVAAS